MIRTTRSVIVQNKNYKFGFTIVELLIVVVVIGIISTISLVAYSGVTQSAAVAVLKSDLKSAQTTLELVRIETGSYLDEDEDDKLSGSGDTVLEYTLSGSTYCLTASSFRAGTSYYVDSASGGVAIEGACDGHEASGLIPEQVQLGPVIASPQSLPTAYMMGDEYSYGLLATGDGPVSFSVTGGSLPAGLTLNQVTGAITGYVASGGLGTTNFAITATDSTGSSTKNFNIKGHPFDSCNDPLPSSFEPVFTSGLTIQAYVTLCGASSPIVVMPTMVAYFDNGDGVARILGTVSNGYLQSSLITAQEACSGVSVRYSWGSWTSEWIDVNVSNLEC